MESSSTFEWSEKGAPVFTLDKAVITALHQNPDVLNALQEIERTKGVIIQIRAQALPRITAAGRLDWTQSSLNRNSSILQYRINAVADSDRGGEGRRCLRFATARCSIRNRGERGVGRAIIVEC